MKMAIVLIMALLLAVTFTGAGKAFAGEEAPCPEPDCCQKIHKAGGSTDIKEPRTWGPDPVDNDSFDGY